MEPELQEALKQFMDKVNVGGDFVLAEMPDVLRQMVVYGRVSCALSAVCGFVLLVVAAVLIRIMVKNWENHFSGYDKEPRLVVAVIAVLGTIVPGVIILFVAIDYSIQAWFTPALYVYNSLLGGGS